MNTPVRNDGGAKLLNQFSQGAAQGAHGRSSLVEMAGDVAARSIPVMGEVLAAKDLYDGVRQGDSTRILAGIIGLIPIVGGASGLLKGGSRVAGDLASTAAKSGASAAALQLKEAVTQGARQLAKDPSVRKLATDAANRAGARALELLQDRLVQEQQSGDPLAIALGQHTNIHDALKATRGALGVKDTSDWLNLFDDQGQVIGRHKPAALDRKQLDVLSLFGFRLVPPQVEDGADPKAQGDFKLIRWKQTPQSEGPPALELGVESFPSSAEEAAAIMQRFAEKARAFRPRKS